MNTEDLYLQAIIENATDDLPRLIYSDWLEERGDPISSAKAEFLRLTAEDAAAGQEKKGRKARRKRLQELAAKLDTAWLAVVSRLLIENCVGKLKEVESPRGIITIECCERSWEKLQATDDRTVRFCDACQHSVHYCDTITEAREHAEEGRCIAVDLGVIRRDGDLAPRGMWLGRPDAETLRREEERMAPDPVSAKREERKRKKAEGAG